MTAEFVMAEKAIAMVQPDEDVLEVAVCEHARLVYRIAYSVLRNAAEAEDAVQEVFLRALRHGKRLAAASDRKAWLARIAWRVAVERRRQELQESARNAEPPTEDALQSEEAAERLLLEKERGEVLHQLIAGLPEQLRDPLVLSALDELSPRETAEMLGISEAAVRARAFRARQLLRERLEARMGVGK